MKYEVNVDEDTGEELKTVTITGYTENVTGSALVIPDMIDGKSVTSIKDKAFNGCTSLKSVTIPGSVKEIGSDAFYGCTSLESVTIQEGVEIIGWDAFSYCNKLTSVTIPASVKEMWSAFSHCIGLESVTIQEGVKSIGESAFYDCTSLKSVTIPGSVEEIGEAAFCSCNSLENVIIPGSVKEIGKYAFNSCNNLTSVIIPGSVKEIGEAAFCGCNNLTSVAIPGSVEKIGLEAFRDCTSLESVTIQEGVENIYHAFSGCNKLTSVTIPGSVKEMESAFHDCIGLESVTIQEGVENIGSAFYGCKNLTSVTIPGSVKNMWSAFQDCIGLESVIIQEGVENIGSYAFTDCNNLTSVTIPASVKEIGEYAFSDCIDIDGDEEEWSRLPKLTLTVEEGSAAEEWAKRENIPFVYSEKKPSDNTGEDTGIIPPLPPLSSESSNGNGNSSSGNGSSNSGSESSNSGGSSSGNENSDSGNESSDGNESSGSDGNGGASSQQPATTPGESNYAVDLEKSQTVSAETFATILSENATKDVVIKSNNDVTFTFAKGTMSGADGEAGYDFFTSINNVYVDTMPSYVTEDNFVSRIDFSHSGKLPGTASIRFPVGTKYAGQTLYYSLMNDDNTFSEVQAAVVDANGYMTVKQDHCSSYVITKTRPTEAPAAPVAVTVKLSKTSYTYNGKARKPKVTVEDSQGNALKAGADYTVKYPGGRKSVGSYTVTVTLKGEYSGTKKASFEIVPKGTSVSKVTAKRKALALEWKKQTSQTTGYQIQYSTSEKFTKKTTETVTIRKNKTTAKTISKLKAKKQYYVRVRTYKTVKVNGKSTNLYSSWSKAKSAKTKQ